MKKKITLQLLMFVGALQFLNAQTIITVDNSVGSNADYSDLQSAISAATAGDIIHVQPSEINYGNISIDKQLTLIGFSHSDATKRSYVTDIQLLDNSSNTRLTGLYLTDDFYTSNTQTITGLVIENCFFADNFYMDGPVDNAIIRGNIMDQIGDTGSNTGSNNFTNTIITNNIIIYYIGLKNHQSVTIKNNIFLSPYNGYPVYNGGSDSGTITVQNNIFYYNANSTYDPNTAGVVFENCLTYNIGSGSVTVLTGSNNLDNQTPLFVEDNDDGVYDALIDDYHLQASSPAIGWGVSGEDLGIFDGGNFVFNNVGFTSGIPTVNIDAISNTVAPGANLNVTISAKTN